MQNKQWIRWLLLQSCLSSEIISSIILASFATKTLLYTTWSSYYTLEQNFYFYFVFQDSGYVIAHYLQFAYPEYQQHKWTSFPHSLLYISRQANVLNCIFIQANRGCARLLNMGRKMLSPSFVPTRCLWRPSCQDTHASSTSTSTGEVRMLSGGSCIFHCAEQPEMSCALGEREEVVCFTFWFLF